MIEVFHAYDVKHRTKDLFARESHFVLHLINDRRAQIKTVRRIRNAQASAIANHFRALGFTAGDEGGDTIAMLRWYERIHVGLTFSVRRTDLDRARRFN